MQHVKQLGHSVLACTQRYSTFTHSLKCNYCNFCRILQFNILLCNQQHGNRLNESTSSRQNDADHHLSSISFMCIAVCLTCMHIELVECPDRLGPQEVEEQPCSSLWGCGRAYTYIHTGVNYGHI